MHTTIDNITITHQQLVALCKQALFCIPHLLQVSPAIIQSLQPLKVITIQS